MKVHLFFTVNSCECTNNLHSDDLLFNVMCNLCGGGFEWKNFILVLFFILLIIVEGFKRVKSGQKWKEQSGQAGSSNGYIQGVRLQM